MNILKIKTVITITLISLFALVDSNEMKAQLSVDGATIELWSKRLLQRSNSPGNLVGLRVFSPVDNECAIELYGGETGWEHRFGRIKGNYNDWNQKELSIDHSNTKPILHSVEDKYTRLLTNNAAIIQQSDGRVSIASSVSTAWNLFKDLGDNDITSYGLFVEKGILTEKVKCAIKTTGDWADYVFEEDYEMMDIDDLEGFVTENKHLPNVPSAEEMVENGLDVAKMDAKLLEKIEEAYLYIIDMNREMNAMSEKVDALATENESLKSSLQSLSTSGN